MMNVFGIIFGLIGMAVCLVGFVYCIAKLVDCTLLERERKKNYERRKANAEVWLGKWGA